MVDGHCIIRLEITWEMLYIGEGWWCEVGVRVTDCMWRWMPYRWNTVPSINRCSLWQSTLPCMTYWSHHHLSYTFISPLSLFLFLFPFLPVMLVLACCWVSLSVLSLFSVCLLIIFPRKRLFSLSLIFSLLLHELCRPLLGSVQVTLSGTSCALLSLL